MRDKRQLGAASAEVDEVVFGLQAERQHEPRSVGHRKLHRRRVVPAVITETTAPDAPAGIDRRESTISVGRTRSGVRCMSHVVSARSSPFRSEEGLELRAVGLALLLREQGAHELGQEVESSAHA